MSDDLSLQLLDRALRDVAREAGRAIRAVCDSVRADRKEDGSVVTQADHIAEQIILAALQELTPAIPVVSEEAHARDGIRAEGDLFWLVDPLDGTREFVAGNGEYTVNIALVRGFVPIFGVVHLPHHDETYVGGEGLAAALYRGDGAAQKLSVREPPACGLTVMVSRSHRDDDTLDAFLGTYTVAERRPAGSALKLCHVARGDADVYPRLGKTMEWDIAAGQAVLEAAGGCVILPACGSRLRYGKPDYINPHFVAWGTRP